MEIMEMTRIGLSGLILGLTVFQGIRVQSLLKTINQQMNLLNDLSYKFNDSMDFLETQTARVHYDLLKRSGKLIFEENMNLADALEKPGAKEILIKKKMIKKRDTIPFKGTLAERARQCQLSIEPIIIALNDLEIVP